MYVNVCVCVYVCKCVCVRRNNRGPIIKWTLAVKGMQSGEGGSIPNTEMQLKNIFITS